jgi:hypothetical protein
MPRRARDRRTNPLAVLQRRARRSSNCGGALSQGASRERRPVFAHRLTVLRLRPGGAGSIVVKTLAQYQAVQHAPIAHSRRGAHALIRINV